MQQIIFYTLICLSSLAQATLSTFMSIIIALPIAHALIHSAKIIQTICMMFGIFCMVMPTQICALGVLCLFPSGGFFAIVCAHVIMNAPLFVYVVTTTYNNIDMHTIWIAQSSCASRMRVYKDAIWPVIKPVVLCIGAITFIYCLSSFSVPLILSTNEYVYTPDIFLYNAYEQSDFFSGLFFIRNT